MFNQMTLFPTMSYQQQGSGQQQILMPSGGSGLQFGGTSVESLNNQSSVNSTSGSFLAAANTIVFSQNSVGNGFDSCSYGGVGGIGPTSASYVINNNNNSVSSNSSFIQLYTHPNTNSPVQSRDMHHHHHPPGTSESSALTKLLEQHRATSFSNTLLQVQNDQAKLNDLDFELNLMNNNNANNNNDNIGSKTKTQTSKTTTTANRSSHHFDENLFDEDDISIDSEYNYDDNHNTSEQFMNELSLANDLEINNTNTDLPPPKHHIRFLLENPVKIAPTKTVPITTTATSDNSQRIIDLNNNNTLANNNKNGEIVNLGVGKDHHQIKYANQNSVNSTHSPPTGVSLCSNATEGTTPQNSSVLGTSLNKTSRSLNKLRLMKQQLENQERKTSSTSSAAAGASTTTANNLNMAVSTTSTLLPQMNNSQSLFSSTTSTNNNDELDDDDDDVQIQPPPVQQPSMTLHQILSPSATFANSSSTTPPHRLVTDGVEIIPRSVLAQNFQIETKLEYPTRYHVMQQLAKSASSTSVTTTPDSQCEYRGKSTRPSTKARQVANKPYGSKHSSIASGDGGGGPNSQPDNQGGVGGGGSSSDYFSNDTNFDQYSCHSVDSQISNLDPSLISSPASSTYDEAALLEEFKSYFNKKTSHSSATLPTEMPYLSLKSPDYKSANSPKTVPTNDSRYLMNMVSHHHGGGGSSHLAHHSSSASSPRPSTSLPADTARSRKLQNLNLTEDEIRSILKDMKEKQKKETHNMIERRRRFNINDRIKELGGILSQENQLNDKQNKGLILKASIDYIRNLRGQVNRTKELEDKLSQMTLLNKKLMERINELEVVTDSSGTTSGQEINGGNGGYVVQSQSGGGYMNNAELARQQSATTGAAELELMPDEAQVLEEMVNYYQNSSMMTAEDRANLNMLTSDEFFSSSLRQS